MPVHPLLPPFLGPYLGVVEGAACFVGDHYLRPAPQLEPSDSPRWWDEVGTGVSVPAEGTPERDRIERTLFCGQAIFNRVVADLEAEASARRAAPVLPEPVASPTPTPTATVTSEPGSPPSIWGLEEAMRRSGRSRATLYRLLKAWPSPSPLQGPQRASPGWRGQEEFDAWLEEAGRRRRAEDVPKVTPSRRSASRKAAQGGKVDFIALGKELTGRGGGGRRR